jgi:hypothetical protein
MPTPDIILSNLDNTKLFVLSFPSSNVVAFYDGLIVFVTIESSAKCTQSSNQKGCRIPLDDYFA